MEIVKVLKDWGDGTQTVQLEDGSCALDYPEAEEIKCSGYPRLNENTGHQYVTGILEKGKGKEGKTGVLYYEQNGYKYDGRTKNIVDKGLHISGEKGS